MRLHQGRNLNILMLATIYHKFSHGAVSYRHIGETVNAMLELLLKHKYEELLLSVPFILQNAVKYIFKRTTIT